MDEPLSMGDVWSGRAPVEPAPLTDEELDQIDRWHLYAPVQEVGVACRVCRLLAEIARLKAALAARAAE